MLKFAIFVDGANLSGSLKRMDLKIKFDSYEAFFKHVFASAYDIWRGVTANNIQPPAQMLRVNWYEPGSIDEWDLSDPKIHMLLRDFFESDRELKRNYMAVAAFKHQGEPAKDLSEEAWNICFRESQEWYRKRRDVLEGMRRFHHSLMDSTDFIEIIECGHWKVDLLYRSITEKGIDTSLAVDMVAMMPSYDVAIVLTGDADTIPSINYVKRAGKAVCVVEFLRGGVAPETRGKQSSAKLRAVADFIVPMYEQELLSKNFAEKLMKPSYAANSAKPNA